MCGVTGWGKWSEVVEQCGSAREGRRGGGVICLVGVVGLRGDGGGVGVLGGLGGRGGVSF